MGKFYRVTKKINGRLYDYWQRTYRVGRSVKTENKYIGPSGTTTADERFEATTLSKAERREDEHIRYGSRKTRVARQAAALAAAKKKARGSKYLNAFLGQAIRKRTGK